MAEPANALPPLRDVIARHELAAKKTLGQHFLLDLNLTGRIAKSAGDLRSGVTIEIGPGPGGLTRALLSSGAKHVVAVEKDERCLAALEEIRAVYPDRLSIVAADALTVRLADLGQPPRRVVANLPYNVSTALLIRWLKEISETSEPLLSHMVLMFQKEVAERLIAQPRTPAYGRLSVMAQWRCRVQRLFDIDPRAFTPPPKIVSTVLFLEPYARLPEEADFASLERITAAAFGQRRKMLRQSLKSLGDAEGLLAKAGIAPTARAEELSVAQFCALARLAKQ